MGMVMYVLVRAQVSREGFIQGTTKMLVLYFWCFIFGALFLVLYFWCFIFGAGS
jgi:hypothetical protein